MPKISDLPADTAPAADDLLVMVDTDASRTESVTVANLAASAPFASQYAPYMTKGLVAGWYIRPMGTSANVTPSVDRSAGGLSLIPRALTVDRIGINVTSGVASSVVRLGIWTLEDDSHVCTLVLDAGTVDTSTTGAKEITISQALAAGVYWVTACPVTGTNAPTVSGVAAGPPWTGGSTGQSIDNRAGFQSFTGHGSALPSPTSFVASYTNVGPNVFLRIAA